MLHFYFFTRILAFRNRIVCDTKPKALVPNPHSLWGFQWSAVAVTWRLFNDDDVLNRAGQFLEFVPVQTSSPVYLAVPVQNFAGIELNEPANGNELEELSSLIDMCVYQIQSVEWQSFSDTSQDHEHRNEYDDCK